MYTTSQYKKKSAILFCVFLFSGLCLAAAAYSDRFASYLGFLWREEFRYLTKTAFGAALLILLFRMFTGRTLFRNALKIASGIILLPLVLLPVFRCFFKVPYIFCGVCPTQCPWGISRTFIFNSAVLLNLSGKFFCGYLCPFGTFQECQVNISKQSFRMPSWVKLSAYAILLAFIAMYYIASSGSHALLFFETGGYGWVTVTVSIASVILIASFFIPRFWCRYACPVGAIAGVTLHLSRFIQKKLKSPANKKVV